MSELDDAEDRCAVCGHYHATHYDGQTKDALGQTKGCVYHDSEGPCLCPGWPAPLRVFVGGVALVPCTTWAFCSGCGKSDCDCDFEPEPDSQRAAEDHFLIWNEVQEVWELG